MTFTLNKSIAVSNRKHYYRSSEALIFVKWKFHKFNLLLAILLSPSLGISQSGPAGVGTASTNKVWLDASFLTGLSNGAKVTTWLDRSGNSWNAFQNTSANRPTYIANQLNGQPVIRFDRTTAGQFLSITSQGIGTVMSNSSTLFAVAKANAGGTNSDRGQWQSIFGAVNSYSGILVQGFPTATNFYIDGWVGNSTRDLVVRGPLVQGEWHIATRAPVENANGTTMIGYVDGTFAGSVSSDLQMTNHNNLIRLGASATSGTHQYLLHGEIAEIILFNVNLNDTERTLVHNYLSAKYGLPIDGDYYQFNHLSYIKDVQGIGTTDGSSDKHAFAGSGKGLIISELNNTLDSPNEFLIAGHNSINNGSISTNVPPGENNRWQREWYIEKTGSVDAKLSFDFSQAGIALPPDVQSEIASYKLLYRSNPSANFSVVKKSNSIVEPILENGDQLAFYLADAMLTNGYYTVGYTPTLIWTGAFNDQWNNPMNWSLNRVPTDTDYVNITSCTTCPTLSQTTTIGGLKLTSGAKLDLKQNTLVVLGASSFDQATITSADGALRSMDVLEFRNSSTLGPLTIQKTGGIDNYCHGGNTFSQSLTISNLSNRVFAMSAIEENTIK